MDQAGDIVGAVSAYEAKIATGTASYDECINLACIYWELGDMGFQAGYHLNRDFVGKGFERLPDLLVDIERRFPGQPETEFWQRYFKFAGLGGNPFVERCKQLAQQLGHGSVPYFYLFGVSGGKEFRNEARVLLERCEQSPTIKNQYIASYLRSNVFAVDWPNEPR